MVLIRDLELLFCKCFGILAILTVNYAFWTKSTVSIDNEEVYFLLNLVLNASL